MRGDQPVDNFEKRNSIIVLASQIRSCIERKLYIAALHMALSLPDALGRIEFSKGSALNRYSKWFDKYVKTVIGDHYWGPFDKKTGHPVMDGTCCYYLRCAFFHELTNDIKQKTGIDEFVISLDDRPMLMGTIAGSDFRIKDSHLVKYNYLYVSAKELSTALMNAALNFVANNENSNYPELTINFCGGKCRF